MNVTMSADVYEHLWSCLRTDFDVVITVYLAQKGWGYETLSSVARQRHVTAYYNWIGVKRGRGGQVYTAHSEAVIKLIIKTAKEVWLPPYPSQPLRPGQDEMNSMKEEDYLYRKFPKDRIEMKRQIGGLFLLWLVYQNQPRNCADRFSIELSLEDVQKIQKFEANLRCFSTGLRGEGVFALRRQIMTILTCLKASGFVNIVLSTDTFGTDEMKIYRNYHQTRKKLAEYGEIDSCKSWRENFLFNGDFVSVIASLDETLNNLELCQKKIMLNGRIALACGPPVTAGRKLATREERYDYFKKLMLRLVREKKHSINHPYMKTIFRIFDKVIMEAPTARTLKGRMPASFAQSKVAAHKLKTPGDEEVESSDEDFDSITIPGELKSVPDKKTEFACVPQEKKRRARPKFLDCIDDFDCEFLDTHNSTNSNPQSFNGSELPGSSVQKSGPLLTRTNNQSGKSGFCGSQEVTEVDQKPNFWNIMNTEEKKEWIVKFKSSMDQTLKARDFVTKITADIEGLAKRTFSDNTTDILSKETLAAEVKRLRHLELKSKHPRKSRAKPKPGMTLSDSPESLNTLLDGLKIQDEAREKLVEQFHEIHSKPTELSAGPEHHKKGLGKYMKLMPKTSEKGVNTDPDAETTNQPGSSNNMSILSASAIRRRPVRSKTQLPRETAKVDFEPD